MQMVLGSWRLVDRSFRFANLSGEGMATVGLPGGTSKVVYRGDLSIPRSVRARGWGHIGDPDSRQGYVFDCYQGPAGIGTKMFRVTTPQGEAYEYEHPLEGDERMNNSYAAVSPDGQWMLSGEWDEMRRILMFPTPILNSATPQKGGSVALAGMVNLDHPVRNVQGATFVSPSRLLFATDDPDTDLWPTARQLLQVDLPAPLDGTTTTGEVTSLGALPLQSRCRGTFEVEGIDYDAGSGDLRVAIIPPPPCKWAVTTIYRFRQET
ncbi:MAG: hypothetical protein ACRDZ8_07425 [Acidimicrobiales bacterium]